MKTGLVVLFPGVRYSVECPLLYYAGLKYELMGFEKVGISSYRVDIEGKTYEQYAGEAKQNVKKQLKHIDFSQYEQIVFVSKSMGTVLAPWVEEELGLSNVSHVFLTPLNLTLPYLTRERDIRLIVAGTADKNVNQDKLREICRKYSLPLRLVKRVGHRLETNRSIEKNIDILKAVIKEI